jgi:hypothetical protein
MNRFDRDVLFVCLTVKTETQFGVAEVHRDRLGERLQVVVPDPSSSR